MLHYATIPCLLPLSLMVTACDDGNSNDSDDDEMMDLCPPAATMCMMPEVEE